MVSIVWWLMVLLWQLKPVLAQIQIRFKEKRYTILNLLDIIINIYGKPKYNILHLWYLYLW